MADQETIQSSIGVPFRRVAVVGAGVMGSGIAQTFAVVGLETICIDLDETVLDQARGRIAEGRYGLARAYARGHLRTPVEEVMSRLHFTTDLRSGVSGCDLVLEAVPEDLGQRSDCSGNSISSPNPDASLFRTHRGSRLLLWPTLPTAPGWSSGGTGPLRPRSCRLPR
jgi:threonine dehydrogenase-like Zn-dependent dehydrogenase